MIEVGADTGPDAAEADAGSLDSDGGGAPWGDDVPAYYGTDRYSLFALNTVGRELWRFSPPEPRAGGVASVAQADDGRLHVLEGIEWDIRVATFDLDSNEWTSHGAPTWSGPSAPGHIATYGRFVFASGETMDDLPAGVVWFDTMDEWFSGHDLGFYSSARYLTVGLDGRLYLERGGNGVSAFDSETRVLDREVYLRPAEAYEMIAVAADGTIYAVYNRPGRDCPIRRFNESGDEVASLNMRPGMKWVAISPDGGSLVGTTETGEIRVMPSDLSRYEVLRPAIGGGAISGPHRIVFARREVGAAIARNSPGSE